MWGYLIAGAAAGLLVGMAVGAKKANAAERTTSGGCPVSDVSRWAASQNLVGVLVTTNADVARMSPDDFDVVVVQSICTVYGWTGSSWEIDIDNTTSLREYLAGPKPPVTRPTPEGVEIPAGPRPVP